jgi:hypothetical protein
MKTLVTYIMSKLVNISDFSLYMLQNVSTNLMDLCFSMMFHLAR